MTATESKTQANQDAGGASASDPRKSTATSGIHAVIAEMYGQAVTLEPVDPNGARWLRAKARYLERGLLKLALEHERDRERSKLENEWRTYKYDFTWHIECTKALVQLSQNALRVAVLINAGAAVGLLTFMGHSTDTGAGVSRFATALSWFAAGLVVAAIASGTAYIAQLCYLRKENEARGEKWHKTAIALFVGALLIFGIGCWITYGAFIEAPTQETTTMTERERPTSPPRPEPLPDPRPQFPPSPPPPRTDEPGKIAPPPARPPGQPSAPSKPSR